LVTDAYSRYIVGYCLSRSLDAEGPLRAMYMALETYRAYGISTEGMIHHSDRGVQYASKQYTLHNALAERMNNTLKNGWLFNEGDMDFRQAEEAVSKSVAMYNNARPHRALGMKTPMEVFSGRGGNPLMEYRYS
ncbi:integrase core domain-containing protein, partial [Phocaeicola plebeius]|uniref:integrase core domain-containing protein n=1 Tax=Phocaeicola plebeius TaxID=310297 RepID=UPI0022E4E442